MKLKEKGFLVFLFIFSGLFLCNYVFSDSITLNSGTVIEGKIIEETATYVKIEYADVPLTYQKESIAQVRRDAFDAGRVNSEIPSSEIPESKDIRISIKADWSSKTREFIEKLDLFGEDMNKIIDAAKMDIAELSSIELDDKSRSIMRKAVSDINMIIDNVKKMNIPGDCEKLQKFFVETGYAKTKQFEGEVDNISTTEDLSKYWSDYEVELETTREKYEKERQAVLDRINKKPQK